MATTQVIKIEADTSKAIKDLEKTKGSLEGVNDELEKTSKTSKEAFKEVADGLDKTEKNAKKAGKGTKVLSKGFNAVGTAFKAMGLGLVLGLFAKLMEVLQSNQKIVDGFATVMETISLVFSKIVTAVSNTIEKVSGATNGFENLKKVGSALLTIVLTPLKIVFNGIKLAVLEAQLAWEKSFFGDKDQSRIKELNASIKETQETLVEIAGEAVQAGKDVASGIGGAINEIVQVAEAASTEIGKIDIAKSFGDAQKIVALRKEVEILAVVNQGLIEEYDIQAEKLRQIRDDERNGIEERKKANNELLAVLMEQQRLMSENAQKAVELAELEYAKNASHENEIKLLEAKNELKAIEAQITGLISEQKANEMALEREAEEKRKEEEEKAREEKEEKEKEALEAKQKQADQEIEIEQSKQDAITNIGNQGFALAGQLLGKGSKMAKSLAVAETLYSTYNGVQSAFTTAQKSPYTLVNPAYPFIQAALAGAFGLSNLMKLKSSSTSGAVSTPSSSGQSVAQAVSTPSVNIVGQQSSNALLDSINTNTSKPVKAYVVGKDVTSQQELDRNKLSNASI